MDPPDIIVNSDEQVDQLIIQESSSNNSSIYEDVKPDKSEIDFSNNELIEQNNEQQTNSVKFDSDEDQLIIEQEEEEYQNELLTSQSQKDEYPNQFIDLTYNYLTKDRYKEKLNIREYQKELFKNSRNKNSIVYLETGLGQTLVSVLHIYYHMKQSPKKKIFFLANTIQLVQQQTDEIIRNFARVGQFLENNSDQFLELNTNRLPCLNEDEIACIHSQKSKRMSVQDRTAFDRFFWETLLQKKQVVVVISQIFLNSLRKAYLKLDDISLIVFDECHHARSNHPYNSIMNQIYLGGMQREENLIKEGKFKKQRTEFPVILGLTASPVQSVALSYTISLDKISQQIKREILELGHNLNSNFVKFDFLTLQKYEKNAQTVVIPLDTQFDSDISVSYKLDFDQKDLTVEGNSLLANPAASEQCDELQVKFYQNQHELMRFLQDNFPEINKLYLEISDLVTKQVLENLSFPAQIIIREIKRTIAYRGLQILSQIGAYSYYRYIYQISECLKELKLEDYDRKLFDQIKLILDTNIKTVFAKYNQLKMENFSLKFRVLLRLLMKQFENQTESNQPMTLIFAKRRIVVHFLNQALNDLSRIGQILDIEIEEEVKFDDKNQEKDQNLNATRIGLSTIYQDNENNQFDCSVSAINKRKDGQSILDPQLMSTIRILKNEGESESETEEVINQEDDDGDAEQSQEILISNKLNDQENLTDEENNQTLNESIFSGGQLR